MMQIFKLETEYIALIQLLKATQIAQSGAHAKMMVEHGEVMVNGKIEYRKRAKLKSGFEVQIEEMIIIIE